MMLEMGKDKDRDGARGSAGLRPDGTPHSADFESSTNAIVLAK
jgi:hypothetical protein